MSQVVMKLDVPKDWRRFKLPPALDARLQDLLDCQDREGKVTGPERQEAKALVQLVDMLSLMKLGAKGASRQNGS